MVENLRRPTHVTKGEAAWAVLSGIVFGSGLVIPNMDLVGFIMGGAVMFKVHKRETRDGSVPFVNAAKYLRDRFRK